MSTILSSFALARRRAPNPVGLYSPDQLAAINAQWDREHPFMPSGAKPDWLTRPQRDDQGNLVGSTGGIVPEFESDRAATAGGGIPRGMPASQTPAGLFAQGGFSPTDSDDGGPAPAGPVSGLFKTDAETPAWNLLGSPESDAAQAARLASANAAAGDALGMAVGGLTSQGGFPGGPAPAPRQRRISNMPTAAPAGLFPAGAMLANPGAPVSPYDTVTRVPTVTPPGLFAAGTNLDQGAPAPLPSNISSAAINAAGVDALGRGLAAQREFRTKIAPNLPLPGQAPEVQANDIAYLQKLIEDQAEPPTGPSGRQYQVTGGLGGTPSIAPVSAATPVAAGRPTAQQLGDLGRALIAHASAPQYIEDPVTGERMLVMPGRGEPLKTGVNPAMKPAKEPAETDLAKLIRERAQARKSGDQETASIYDQAIANYHKTAGALGKLADAIDREWQRTLGGAEPTATTGGAAPSAAKPPASTVAVPAAKAPASAANSHQMALAWARANPNDPRASRIMQLLGAR